MAVSCPLDIEVSNAGAVDRVHDLGDSTEKPFQHSVIVAVHPPKGVDDCLVSFGGGLTVFQKRFPVLLALENDIACIRQRLLCNSLNRSTYSDIL